MAQFWVDLENIYGAKYGDGPITSAVNWQHTANLDRAGTFSFTMPADDARCQYLGIKRIARCWTVEGGELKHLGAGSINDVQRTLDADGRAMLTVSGDDLLAELINRIVPLETLNEQIMVHPARATVGTESSSGSIPTAKDFAVYDTTSWVTINNTAIYIHAPEKFDRIYFTLHSAQSNGGGGSLEYKGRDGTWTAISETLFTNTTKLGPYAPDTGGIWFGQSGYFEWDIDDLSGWDLQDIGAAYGPDQINYMLRFVPPTLFGWTAFDISDIAIRVTEATDDAIGRIMTYAPQGWQLDAGNGYTTTATRPFAGNELVVDGGFVSVTGTVDDTTTDTFGSWYTAYTNDSNGDSVLSVSGGRSGNCVKVTHGATGNYAVIGQDVPCDPSTEYTVSYWTKGTGEIGLSLGQLPLSEMYYLEDSGVTGSEWTQVTKTFVAPQNSTHVRLAFFAPTAANTYALIDDVSLKAGGGKAITLSVAGETVLEQLIRVAETTGEHFVLSPNGRQVLWLGHDERPSGMRCVAHLDPIAAESHPEIAIISRLSEVYTGTNLVSRVYPYGGGSDPIPTLRNTTRSAPEGYTLDKTNNYLSRNQSEAAYGRIERRLDIPDVENISGDPSGDTHSCNMLFDRAYAYLRRNSATVLTLEGGDVPRVFELELVKCDRVILPGYTVHVEYDRYQEGYRRIHIDNDLWVLSSTVRADESGVHTVALQCSTVDALPATDNQLIANMLRQQRAMQAYKAGV